MDNTGVLQKEKISFIKRFSEKEWLLNGWKRENPRLILQVFGAIALFVKDGNYLELGCGSGILCKFLFLFSGKEIIPYGVDINSEAVKLAKKNNPEFADNFRKGDYFELLKSNVSDFKKFSTINIFISCEEYSWNKLYEEIAPIVKRLPKINFLICAYDVDFLPIKEKQIAKFVSEIKKISPVSIASHCILIIGRDEKMHKIAEEMRKETLGHLSYTKDKFITRKTVEGFIAEKNPSFFYLTKQNKFKQKRTPKLKFFLASTWNFGEVRFSYAGELISERVINWQKIRKGDRVMVMFGRDKQKNIVFAVKKLLFIKNVPRNF